MRIDRVELRQFKSFGGSVAIPLEPGFTVVTGPNGSGKSNILDGILFCLGLATSRGMRAERLPDLINSGATRQGKGSETEVSVRFDLSGWQPDAAEEGLERPAEGPWIARDQTSWTVSRRLRLAPGGTYSSTYSADGVPCTLPQLQAQLRRLRVDPEGSNVVMQGDVTRIVSMGSRERRGLIDELAGVALFDARIEQSRGKLDEVQERQDRCRIVEQELLSARQRLERDCAKARSYQALREQLQEGRLQEQLLSYEQACRELEQLVQRRQTIATDVEQLGRGMEERRQRITEAAAALQQLQAEVRALGEEQLLAVQGEIAGLDASEREVGRRSAQLQQRGHGLAGDRQRWQTERQRRLEERRRLEEVDDGPLLEQAEATCRTRASEVDLARRRLSDVAGRSEAWLEEIQERAARRDALQSRITPLQQEQERLDERLSQTRQRMEDLQGQARDQQGRGQRTDTRLQELEQQLSSCLSQITAGQKRFQEAAAELDLQQRTRQRLEREQQGLEQQIARAESRRATLQEQRGTNALRTLLASGLEGVHGPVAQLAEVEESLRLALEVAAGGRLAQVVVDDDGIAARAIELLKSRRAGRLTFLPLNKLRARSGGDVLARGALSRGTAQGPDGLVGRAVDLIRCEAVYEAVFQHVFGDTQVYRDLASARRQLGRVRAVTLEGELLERSGAMTGGSLAPRSDRLSFGSRSDEDNAEPLRRRLLELGEALVAGRQKEHRLSELVDTLRPRLQELERTTAALEAERSALKRDQAPADARTQALADQLTALAADRQRGESRLAEIAAGLAPLLEEMGALDQRIQQDRERDRTQPWTVFQEELERADQALETSRQQRDALLSRRRERQLALDGLSTQDQQQQQELHRLEQATAALAAEQAEAAEELERIDTQRRSLTAQRDALQTRFGEQRRARDQAEAHLAGLNQQQQQDQWNLERLKEEDRALEQEGDARRSRLLELERALPDPRPVVPEERRQAGLAALVAELGQIQRRMEALEPVNMLALQELEELEERLQGLADRLEVLGHEREELMLRIETVATLRQEAFMEAFQAVDGHFREIFAALSDGDGHLQLDTPEDPLAGGLTLVAHPRGKSVRRLASMSGGEKSLTALSFLFALQRFRPSPFYALDEVDSFLDGVNVERLAGLIQRQACEAQFLVVSHRRPMIGAAERTIGVTQARGAHTQVVGLPAAA
ncbi:chromosome segregation protein SMC [Synechococcus sp. RSCCF101]|uniref:chromosome segregation protein SMC n=1 Tax=Synechococcus sp. RSCCF101 TaxID=2511069 RepID=UPI001CD9CEF0|nr:chromosome segregation protein SMC [Synechococcus sp. RSCCF101]